MGNQKSFSLLLYKAPFSRESFKMNICRFFKACFIFFIKKDDIRMSKKKISGGKSLKTVHPFSLFLFLFFFFFADYCRKSCSLSYNRTHVQFIQMELLVGDLLL